jgi:hypothetical protein
MRKLIRFAGLFLARIFGTKVRDVQTDQPLGKALIIPWRGKIHIIGLEGDVRPIFQPQKRLTYWKQEIVFTTHPPVDFPKEKSRADRPKQDAN